MKKQYLFILTVAIGLFFTLNGFSQTNDLVLKSTLEIEELAIFPNPVSQGKVYISSKNNATKQIEIYNVLSMNIYINKLFKEEVNVVKHIANVYIIKKTKNHVSSIRKLNMS